MMNTLARRGLTLGGLTLALALAPGMTPPAAQAAPAASAQGANVTISLRDAPLRTALQTLFEGSGLQHAVEPTVPNYPITLDIRDVPFQTALRTMLRLAPGITFRKEGDIYIVGLRQQTVPQETVQDFEQPDTTAAVAEAQSEKIPLNYSNYQVMGYVLGAIPIPTEDQVQGGGGGGGFGGGGLGGGVGGYSGGGFGGGGLGGGGFGGGLGGGGFGGGLGGGGFGGGLGGGGFGGGLGGGLGGGGFGGGLGGGGCGGGIGGLGGGGFGGGGFGGGGFGGVGGGTGFSGPRARRF